MIENHFGSTLSTAFINVVETFEDTAERSVQGYDEVRITFYRYTLAIVRTNLSSVDALVA